MIRVAAVVVASFVFAGCRQNPLVPVSAPDTSLISCECQIENFASDGSDVPFPFLQFVAGHPNDVGFVLRAQRDDGTCGAYEIKATDIGVPRPLCGNTQRAAANGVRQLEAFSSFCRERLSHKRCLALDVVEDKAVVGGRLVSFEEKCRQLCAEPSETQFVELQSATSRTLRFFEVRVSCPPVTAVHRSDEICGPLSVNDPDGLPLAVDPLSSSVEIVGVDGGGAVHPTVRGFLSVDRSRCGEGLASCSVSLLTLHLRISNFTVNGEAIKDIALGIPVPMEGVLFSGGGFRIPQSSHQIGVRGTLVSDGIAREGLLPISVPILGRIDEANRVLTLVIEASSAELGANLRATISATFENVPPRAVFEAESVVECTDFEGALVPVDASGTVDPDDASSALSYDWFVDQSPMGSGQRTTLRVPLGEHTIQLRVRDTAFHVDWTNKQVVVRDTTPPRLRSFAYSGPVCLWPPKHKYVVLSAAEDFQAVIEDACDPAPTLVVSSATSSQPDNSVGDGNTSDDVVRFADRVCLQVEREGTDLAPRRYDVGLSALDHAGNFSDPIVTLLVPHDGNRTCSGDLAASRFVTEGDPLCTPSPAAEAPGSVERRSPGGCSAGGSFAEFQLLSIGLLLLLFSSRRGRSC